MSKLPATITLPHYLLEAEEAKSLLLRLEGVDRETGSRNPIATAALRDLCAYHGLTFTVSDDGKTTTFTEAKPLTILDIAIAKGAHQDDGGAIAMGEFERLNLPFFSGCQGCGASLAPYNAYPSTTGFIQCKDCLDDRGFKTVEEFDAATNSPAPATQE